MSLDYPFYEELRRLKHPGARWWRVGDALSFAGIILAPMALAGSSFAIGLGLLGLGWQRLQVFGVMFAVGVPAFLIGSSLKGHAYRVAERDGISAVAVYRRGGAEGTETSDPGGSA